VRKALLVVATAVTTLALAAPAAQAAPPTLVSCTDREALIYLDTTWNCEFPGE